MFPWQDVFKLVVQGVIAAYYEPIFWLIIGMVAYQYWQAQRSQLAMFGIREYNMSRQVVTALVLGSVGGIIGSLFMTLAGVTLNQIGFGYIWPVALVLMLFNLRFLCFAYAGGLVAMSSVLFGWPEVNVPQVVGLVAVLHVTESILIAISGGYGAAPVILRREDGRMVGAFTLQNFWPLPLVALAAVAVPLDVAKDGMMNMPDWWPLIPLGLEAPEGKQWLYVMVPVIAALGYSDIAISKLPYVKRLESSGHLALYSVLLLGLAVLASKYQWLEFAAALAAPLGHELLIQLDNRREMNAEPRFVPPPEGLMVLDSLPGSPAESAGLRSGDIIRKLDGVVVETGYDLARAIAYAPPDFVIEYTRDGQWRRKETSFDHERMLGVILVPNGDEPHYVELANKTFWAVDWIKRKFHRDR